MKTIRNLTWGIGVFLLLQHFNLYSQQKPLNPEVINKILRKNDFMPAVKKISPVAKRAMQKGEKPGTFKGVHYAFKKNVALLKPHTKNTLARSITKNGIINKKTLGTVQLHSDSIYVDPQSNLIFQPAAVTEDTLMIFKPKFREVFEDITIPDQQVSLNLANTDYTLEGSRVSEKTSGQNYTMIMRFDSVVYQIEEEKKTKYGNTKLTLNVTLDGMIGFTNPVIEGKYTKNNGYKLVFKAGEHIDMKIRSEAKLAHKTSIPIWGYDIPAENIGNCKVGVFLVITVDGEINLEVHADQGINFASGIKGGTFYYFPKNVKYVNNTTSYCNIDYTISGKIKAFGGIDCIAEMKIKGYDVLKLRIRGGVEANVEKTKDNMNLDADLGFRVLIDGEVKELDKEFTLYDKYFLIWQKRERNFGGYDMSIKEADAYYDRVYGTILQKVNSEPYIGALTLYVTHSNGSEKQYSGRTNEDGIFAMTGIPLKKGDKVSVKISASPNRSPAVDAGIPFKEIALTMADYYTNTVEGNVSSRISTFPANAVSQNVPSPAVKGNAMQAVQNVSKINRTAIKPSVKLNFKSFQDALTYKGPVEIIVEPTAKQFNKNIPATSTNNPVKTGHNKAGFNVSGMHTTDKTAMNPGKAQNIQQLPAFTTVINKPFGGFEIRNAKIEPGDRVKARINIDGFIIESPWVPAEGLVFSTIMDEHPEGSIFDKEISARNSMVIVSALHSDQAPSGKVRMVKGIDMRHSSATMNSMMNDNKIKLDLFKQARHPLVFFDKVVDLKPVNGSAGGASVAETGPWHINNIYYSPAAQFSIWKVDGHRFEYVGYTFENRWTGYKYYQETCSACKSMQEDKLKQLDQMVQNNSMSQGSVQKEYNDPLKPAAVKIRMVPGNGIQNQKMQQGKFQMH